MEDHRAAYLQDLAALIAVRSVRGEAEPGKPYGAACAEALAVGETLAAGYGFRTENHENQVLTADFGPEDRAVDILAHLDVVAEGVGWESDPFTLQLDGDLVYGRGVADDKGPALTALYAMRALKELGVPMQKGVRMILGANEECGCTDVEHYYKTHAPAPSTMTPDADFPIYNTEKGQYQPTFTAEWDKSEALPRVSRLDGGFVINALPSDADGDVLGLTAEQVQPVLANVSEQTGVRFRTEPIDGGVRIFAHGVQAHASLPHLGNNGITALIAAFCALPLADCGSTRALRALRDVFPHGDCYGKALGIAMEDAVSGRLTLAFSILHLQESGLQGRFDSRVPLCGTVENCQTVAEERLRTLGFTPEGRLGPGHHTPAEGTFVSTLLRV